MDDSAGVGPRDGDDGFRYPPPPVGSVDIYGFGTDEIADAVRETSWLAVRDRVPTDVPFVAVRVTDKSFSTGGSEADALSGFLDQPNPEAIESLRGVVYVRRPGTPYVSRLSSQRAAARFGGQFLTGAERDHIRSGAAA